MNRRRLINWLCCLFLSMNYVHAQSPHWECNISDYEYDMTMYLNLQIDGQMVVNHDGYEIAAFCGDECRGVATVEKIDGIADATYYYLRVRSNQATGDNFSIKGYEKDSKKEFDIDGSVEFVSQSVIGYPSSPSILEYKNTYRIAFVVDGNLMSEYSLLWGSEVTVPEIPTKEGYTFSGWSEIPATMPAEDVTVTGSYVLELAEVNINISMKDKWNTCVLTFDTELPASVQAYTSQRISGAYLILEEVESLKAYTPYILYAENGYEGTFAGVMDISNYQEIVISDFLNGAIAEQEISSGYVLQNQGNGSMFYKINGQTFTVPAGKCWLANIVPGVATVRISTDATGIENVKIDAEQVGLEAVYDLNGQFVTNPEKGHIYVVNGKKVLKM